MPLLTKCVVLLALLLSTPLHAADLGGHSRLGAVFTEPAAPVVAKEEMPLALRAFPSPKLPGYYGRAGDFSYRNYYGTAPAAIFGRLPYACGLYGYC